jgi:branched-chain amino acid aminotransferase
MMPTTAKASGQYINSVLAVREAVNRGFDEALLLDVEGNVAEGSGENLFIVKDGQVFTNDERHSILLGITRDAVIQIAQDLGYEVNVGPISLSDLLNSDEAFFTGTAAEVTPIREVDGTLINHGDRGPVTKEIQSAFFAATSGRHQRYRDWLTFVVPQTVAGIH